MKNNKRYLNCLIILLFCSCSSDLLTGMKDQKQNDFILTEIRTELADLRQQMNHHKVEFQIVDEKLDKLQTGKKSEAGNKSNDLARLEKRILDLERMFEKTKEDLREIASHANQTTTAIAQYKEKILECEKQIVHQSAVLDDVSKLKGTLKSISKAMHENTGVRVHKVKAGDSLEKIAKITGSNIDELRKINGLNNDKIIIGQELKIPHDK